MKPHKNDHRVLRYHDHDLNDEERMEIHNQLSEQASARDLLDAYERLETSMDMQPTFEPTRDFSTEAIEQVAQLAEPVSKRVLLSAMLGIIALLCMVMLPFLPLRPMAPANEVANPTITDRSTFHFSSREESTFARIRTTRERLRTRKSPFNS